jgi:hypothetical protein
MLPPSPPPPRVFAAALRTHQSNSLFRRHLLITNAPLLPSFFYLTAVLINVQAFREELGLVVQSLQKDTTDVKNRLGGSPWDVWRLSLLEADRKRLEAASVYFVATSCQRKDDRDHKIIYASSWIEKLTG